MKPGWPKAVIFDLDGTLIDSAPDLAGSLNTLLERELSLPALPLADIRLMIGAGVPKLIERGLRAHGADEDHAPLVQPFMDIYLARATRETRLYPGGRALLHELADAGVILGLCTNKPTEISLQILNDLGVKDFFASIIGGTSGYPKKPDPAAMNACLGELGVTSSEAIFIGDSPVDVKTARNASIPVIVMSYGYTDIPAAELGADMAVNTLSEIPKAIEMSAIKS